jgi:hypothetical protein
MRALSAAMLALLLAFGSLSCAAAEPCPRTDRQLDWSSRCFEAKDAARRVKAAYVKRIVADQSGHALIMIGQPRELVAVDRGGVVTIPGIFHTGDFDYPNAREGLGRFQVASRNQRGEAVAKCGYFDAATLKIAIPPVYDHCQPFDQGAAAVCNDCAMYCTEAECQNSVLVGGQGFAIDKGNQLLRRFTPPSLDTVCGGPSLVQLKKIGGTRAYLRCAIAADSPDSPFEPAR